MLAEVVMKVSLLALCFAFVCLPVFSQAARSQLLSIPTCVEVTGADIPVSARRRGDASDCDPSQARNLATLRARANASAALAPTCLSRASRAMAARACGNIGLRPATSHDVNQTGPVGTTGSTTPNAAIGIGQSGVGGLRLCAVVRDLPNEAATSTSPAGADHGFCIFNNGRVTNFTARARARCGVTCS
ncbi:hypothetical protein ABIB66_008912 [Bradyrhizobium sp. F1.13.3]